LIREKKTRRDEESGTRKKVAFLPTLRPLDANIHHHKFYDRDEALNSILGVAWFNYDKRTRYYIKDHYFVKVSGEIGIGKNTHGI
jgi:hypothetical protein